MMQYNQPADQPNNPSAPYINGNPAAGIQGSIVPAAAVEYPQREIVACINAVGLTPTNGNLAQLLASLQRISVENALAQCTNTGSATAWIGAIPPLPSMPPPIGTAVWFKPGLASAPGGTTFALNGFTAPVTMPDLSAIRYGDVSSTSWLLLFYDGTEWQVLVGSSRPPGGLSYLDHNITWYVNQSIGSDTNYDGTVDGVTQPISGTHGPFATIQRAVTETKKYNLNGFDQFIMVAAGAYTGMVSMGETNGTGTVHLVGNNTTPASCTLSISPSPYQQSGFSQTDGNYAISGFRISVSSGPFNGDPGDGITVSNGKLQLSNLQFGPCVRAHIAAGFNSTLTLEPGTITIEGAANATDHLLCALSSDIVVSNIVANQPSLNILGPVTFSGQFIYASNNATALVLYQSITGASNVTGQRYSAQSNAVINTNGAGANYYPGTIAGVVSSGGEYV
jgi:hypothetical protein